MKVLHLLINWITCRIHNLFYFICLTLGILFVCDCYTMSKREITHNLGVCNSIYTIYFLNNLNSFKLNLCFTTIKKFMWKSQIFYLSYLNFFDQFETFYKAITTVIDKFYKSQNCEIILYHQVKNLSQVWSTCNFFYNILKLY